MMKRILAATLVVALLPLLPIAAMAEAGFSGDVAAINEAAKSVLLLETYDENDVCTGTGSGFVAFENDILVTNFHVMEDSENLLAYSDEGNTYLVNTVYAASEEADLAILGFAEVTDRAPLPLGDGEAIQRAEPVVAIGSPKGMLNTVSMGNVSSVFEEYGVEYIQFTAPISSGSSGGALFNDRGEVVGVTSASYDDGHGIVQNLNFAVNIEEVKRLYAGVDRNSAVSLAAYRQGARPGADSAPPSGIEGSSSAAVAGTVLINQGGVLLELTESSYDPEYPKLRFDVRVHNASGQKISISVQDVLADGQGVQGIGIYNVADGADIPEYFFLCPYDGDPDNLAGTRALSFNLEVWVSDTYKPLFKVPVSLEGPFAEEIAAPPAAGGGYVLIDQGGVYLEIAAGYFDASFPMIRFDGTVINRSGQEISIYVLDAYVDGVQHGAGGIFNVADGAATPEYFFVCPEEGYGGPAASLQSAQTITLVLDVSNADSQQTIFQVPVTFARSGSGYIPSGVSQPAVPSTPEQSPFAVTEDGNYVLIDQGGVYLEAAAGYFDASFPMIRFDGAIMNNSGEEISIYVLDAYVDGVKHGAGGIFNVADGAAIPEYFFVCPEEGRGGSSQVLQSAQAITLVLDVSNADSQQTIFQVPVTFARSGSGYIPSGAYSPSVPSGGTFDFTRDMTGALLIDQGGVRMEVTSYKYDADYPSLDFHVDVTNDTGREINLRVLNARADGQEIQGYCGFNLASGRSSKILFFQDLADGASGLPSATEIAFVIQVQDANNYESLFEVPMTFRGPFGGSAPAPTPRPTSRPASTAALYRHLKKGDQGEDVRKLQKALIALGYLTVGEADGVFGGKTERAIYDFRENNGMLGTGSDYEATISLQEYIFSGSPIAYTDPSFALVISDDAYGEWAFPGNDRIRMRVEVTNIAKHKTVKAFELYMYAIDVWGDAIYGEDMVYYATTTTTVAPGKTVYSDYITMPNRSQIDQVYVGISKVVYTDGTVVEANYIEYSSWTIN